MGASKPEESSVEVRIEHSLNEKEKEFVAKRRNDVLQSLNRLKIPCSENEVPNIALLGSGGGGRAMVGLLGSLVQLQKTGLLDSILYLSGVSGSTWCMASLYKEPDWSTKLDTVKDKIVQRLSGPGISWGKAFAKLKKYYNEKDIFSLTDVWAVMFVTDYVKEIDEHTLTDLWDQHSKDPFPIYTAIDKQCKQLKDGDPWFEISPHEAGYSLTGAFVETSNFGSKFENGQKIKDQPEIDMLYLQALCGSALADEEEILQSFLEKIKEFLKYLKPLIEMEQWRSEEKSKEDPNYCPIDECYQLIMDLVDMNLSVLNDRNPPDHSESIETKLRKITGGKHQLVFSKKKMNLTYEEAAKQHMKQFTEDVCNALIPCLGFWPLELCLSILKCVVQWIWGRKYDFLYNVEDKTVPSTLLKTETRDFEDAGLLLNSPYFSVLRKEREIDLIISLDFSDGDDAFTTVKEAAETSRKLNIPFPEVDIPSEDLQKPKDFYVFKGKNTPTVIHIPLFNVINCGEKIEYWRNTYTTLQGPYSAEKITDLMEVAGKNITNNKNNLLEQIHLAIKAHK